MVVLGILTLCGSAWGSEDLVAHWSLNEAAYDSNYLDTVAGYIAHPNGEPNFITGVRNEPNGAAVMTSSTGWGISQALGSDFSTNGFTICFWFKWNGNWEEMIDINDLVVESSGSEAEYIVTDGMRADQHWRHVCITYGDSIVRIYLNGRLRLAEVGELPGGAEAVIEIGNSLQQQIFNGAIDDIRLYNYPLSQTEITQLVTGNENCILEYALMYDVSGLYGVPDCTVDIYDLAGLAEHWLENCTPECNLEYDFTGFYSLPDYTVNLYDLVGFANHWLENGW
jgi:hypothetical protein